MTDNYCVTLLVAIVLGLCIVLNLFCNIVILVYLYYISIAILPTYTKTEIDPDDTRHFYMLTIQIQSPYICPAQPSSTHLPTQ